MYFYAIFRVFLASSPRHLGHLCRRVGALCGGNIYLSYGAVETWWSSTFVGCLGVDRLDAVVFDGDAEYKESRI